MGICTESAENGGIRLSILIERSRELRVYIPSLCKSFRMTNCSRHVGNSGIPQSQSYSTRYNIG